MPTKKIANTIPLESKAAQPMSNLNTEASGALTSPKSESRVEVEVLSGQKSEESAIASQLGGLVGNPLVTGQQSITETYASLAHLQSDEVPSMSASQADQLIGKNEGKVNYLRVVESNNNLVRQGIKTAESFVKVEEAAWKFGGSVVAAKEAKAETLHKEEMHGLNNKHRSTVRETAGYRNQRAETVRDKAKAKIGQRDDIKF